MLEEKVLYEQRKEEEKSLFFEAIRKVGERQNNVKRISKNICVVKFSDLIDKPWSVSYHLWYASANALIAFLKNKDTYLYKPIIKEALKKAKNDVCYIKDETKRNVALQPLFLEFVLKEIQDLKSTKDEQGEHIYAVTRTEWRELFKSSTTILNVFRCKRNALNFKKEQETKYPEYMFNIEKWEVNP